MLQKTRPMKNPPATLAARPVQVTPPLVPCRLRGMHMSLQLLQSVANLSINCCMADSQLVGIFFLLSVFSHACFAGSLENTQVRGGVSFRGTPKNCTDPLVSAPLFVTAAGRVHKTHSASVVNMACSPIYLLEHLDEH